MAIPVLIITGFLGCGKTSFLRRLLPLCGERGLRPMLIINEVGEVDVDGELLDDLSAEQARLIGGCVCCTLQAQLSRTVYDLLERKAGELIIIECSGLSNPIDVISALSAPALLHEITITHVICLLDSPRVEKVLAIVELARAQAQTADVVILNKMDKLSAERRPEVEALAREVAPHSRRYAASYGDIGGKALHALLDAPAHEHKHEHEHEHKHDHALPASFCTVALPLPETITRAELEALLQALPENVIRAKGFAFVTGEGWCTLHRVFDTVDIVPFTSAVPAAGAILICIGRHLDADVLRGLVLGVGV